jgi:hypothetical protein
LERGDRDGGGDGLVVEQHGDGQAEGNEEMYIWMGEDMRDLVYTER